MMGFQVTGNSLFDYLNQAPPMPVHDLVATGSSSGIIDQDDLNYLVENILGSVIGDLDRDYEVTISDYDAIQLQPGVSTGYFTGDLNGDNSTDLQDFALFQRKFATSGSVLSTR